MREGLENLSAAISAALELAYSEHLESVVYLLSMAKLELSQLAEKELGQRAG